MLLAVLASAAGRRETNSLALGLTSYGVSYAGDIRKMCSVRNPQTTHSMGMAPFLQCDQTGHNLNLHSDHYVQHTLLSELITHTINTHGWTAFCW